MVSSSRRKDVDLFKDRPDEDAAAFDDAEADVARRAVRDRPCLMFAAGNHEHLVGADFGVAAGPNAQKHEQHEQQCTDADHDGTMVRSPISAKKRC